ncbi:lysine 2,3-aminomutase [Carboxylicivirga sediminis]|uniref:L-lysine 2,3-aminomutase n=1 Tax=Carboxylicivirga sediminis TaxID=2006564 RepID=A0A941IY94_9BACT|nr:lysine 2,3-aminomutase [Carboxylicivirga sediminis]MBR8535572.1 lysine 2,3-aminomutase [Carboxylicivirga sediminis]
MIYNDTQQEIANKIETTSQANNWKDWRWQLRNTIKNLEQFERLTGIQFNAAERTDLKKTFEKFPLSITPYYLSLIDKTDYKNNPVFKQAFGGIEELSVLNTDMSDPLSEDKDSPVEGITHRYPDRVLFHVSNICAMYCRHCTRKRKVGDKDHIPSTSQLKKGIEYIAQNKQVRDVLLSGGDPFMLPDDKIDWLLSELKRIPHIEVIRIGTRMPVVLPYRITDNLVKTLKKYQPLWINTHFNHPNEITTSAMEALTKLADGGFPLGNQSVLLAGVNDCPKIMRTLLHQLVQNRVRPYYLYQCDLSEGLSHFRTPIGKGIEIMESLIGHTSGFARPTYVIDAPGGGGKIPVMPNYIISWSTNKVILRNYEGVITTYKEPDNYEQKTCNQACDNCNLELSLNKKDESEAIGIEKLLSDSSSVISLIPENNERVQRRSNSK